MAHPRELNPYAAPESSREPVGPRQPPIRWLVCSVVEWYIVFTIIGILLALYYPAVNRAKELRGDPLLLPVLDGIFSHFEHLSSYAIFWVAVAAGAPLALTCALVAVRSVLPERPRSYLPWMPRAQGAKPTGNDDLASDEGRDRRAVNSS